MRRSLLLTTAIVVVTAVAAGCSGDDDTGSSDASDQDEVTVMGEETGDETPATLDDGRPTLTGVLEQRDDASTKVTYQRGEDTFSIAQDGGRRAVRNDSSLVLLDGDTTVSCETVPEPTCLELPPEVRDLVSTELTLYSVVERSLDDFASAQPLVATTDATIAGRPAVCVEARAGDLLADISEQLGAIDDFDDDARVCVDAETGFILEFSSDRAGMDDLVAVAVEEPSDADFEPPAAVDPLPDDDLQ